eukprot:6246142-Prorocentrum_lima.AAC.1
MLPPPGIQRARASWPGSFRQRLAQRLRQGHLGLAAVFEKPLHVLNLLLLDDDACSAHGDLQASSGTQFRHLLPD